KGLWLRVAGPLGPWPQDIATLLAVPAFRRLWLSTCASNFVLWTEMIITSWVALQLTGSPWLVALAGVCRAAPVPLIGPLSGALADRVDRMRLVRIAQWGNLTALSLLAGSMLTGHGAYWQLLVIAIWLGMSMALEWPSRRVLLMDLAGPDHLLSAVVLDRVTQSVARVVGPLLAGALLALWAGGAYAALVLFPALSLLALGDLAAVHTTRQADGNTVWRQLREGLVYVRREPVIWAVLLLTVAMNCFVFPAKQLYAVIAEDVLRVGPVELGWMGAANGLGAPLGLLLLPRISSDQGYRWTLVVGAMLASLALAAFAGSTSLALALALLVLSGIGQAVFAVMQATLILGRTDPAFRGRAMGLLVLATGSTPIGALEAGAVAERWGAPLAIGTNALLCTALVAMIALSSPQLLRDGPEGTPAPAAAGPQLREPARQPKDSEPRDHTQTGVA
ncbi:MAG: MFS transporter, partial [Planctomycetota bacterium]|nr:MFS transporter [Planctomycetota bacterium]